MTIGQLRPIRIEGNVAFIPLTKGYEATVDAADFPLVEGYNWQAQVLSYTVYARRTTPRDSQGKQQTIYLHNVILPPPDGLLVDHADTNGLNCRRGNLRHCTQAQNQQNRNRQSRNTSGFKGVTWNKAEQKWDARICANRKRVFLGLFDTPEDAVAAYDAAKLIYHGEFAR